LFYPSSFIIIESELYHGFGITFCRQILKYLYRLLRFSFLHKPEGIHSRFLFSKSYCFQACD